MYKLTKEELDSIKKIELDLLIEFDKICKENHINYSLAYGTLIGAIRHKGFIPWDDDIDVIMLRDDYDKFLNICSNIKEKNYYISNYKTVSNYPYPFTKMMAKNTLMKENCEKYTKFNNGVWIDIFPLDYCNNNESIRRKELNKTAKIRKILFCKANYYFNQKLIKLILYRIKKIIYLPLSYKYLISKYENIVKKNKKTSYVINNCGVYGLKKEVFKTEWFNEYIDIEFEKHTFKCIKDYDKYLRHVYNDYMKLPPIENRVAHHYLYKFNIDKYKK